MSSAYLRRKKIRKKLRIENRSIPKIQPKREYYKPHRHAKLYSSGSWKKLRKLVLNANPICVLCNIELATEVDHIVKHEGNEELFHDITNLQSVCNNCHKEKTRRER